MTAVNAQPSLHAHLLFDADETVDAFRNRQRSAYQTGKLAWREGLINAQALQLYNEIVQCVGRNSFTWIKEETLAAQLDRNVSTIKRWMRQLVAAHLIRRARRFGSASETYVTAYAADNGMSAQPDPPASAGDTPMTQPSCSDATQPESSATPPVGTQQEVVAFTTRPSVGCKNEPSNGSQLRRDPIKDPNVKSFGGGGKGSQPSMTTMLKETGTMWALASEGIVDTSVLLDLQHRPIDEVERVIRYVTRCRRKDDPRRPGLIVHLVRQGFGQLRPDSGASSERKGRRRGGQPTDRTTVPMPPVACHDNDSAVGQPGADAQTTATYPDDGSVASASEQSELWTIVQTHLQRIIPADEYATWIEPATLLLLEDEHAFVGTPNIFVRDALEQRYGQLLATTLEHALGKAVQIDVVLDG